MISSVLTLVLAMPHMRGGLPGDDSLPDRFMAPFQRCSGTDTDGLPDVARDSDLASAGYANGHWQVRRNTEVLP